MMDPKVIVSTSTDETLHETAKFFVRVVVQASKQRERVSIVLSGGHTPRGLYLLLSDRSESYFPQIPWGQLDFFWSDERFVPSNDKNSNFLMAKNTLFDRVPVEKQHIHRMITEDISAEESADLYQQEIKNFFGRTDLSDPPAFDLVILGMGPDGHTASLFPDAPLEELESGPFSRSWVKSFLIPRFNEENPLRISLTPKLINAAENVVFLVTGGDKAQAFDQVFHSEKSPHLIPAKLIKPKSGNLFWMIDQEVVGRERLAS
jgi:6-phosphogluconolactonase